MDAEEIKKEKARQRAREWNRNNKERLLARVTKWTKENPDRVRINKKRYYAKNKEEVIRKASHSCPKGRLANYKMGAKYRNHEWTLSDAEALDMFNQPCHYCKAEPKPLNGIDRKDSKKGYLSDNAVPCCWPCNAKKQTTHYDAFVQRKGWLKEK